MITLIDKISFGNNFLEAKYINKEITTTIYKKLFYVFYIDQLHYIFIVFLNTLDFNFQPRIFESLDLKFLIPQVL